jgi:hypothetical protein
MEQRREGKERNKMITQDKVQELIKDEGSSIIELLLSKNREYGNSAIYPDSVFSNASNIVLIDARIDDKLSRIKNNRKKVIKEDTVLDLIGYLILRRVAERVNNMTEKK